MQYPMQYISVIFFAVASLENGIMKDQDIRRANLNAYISSIGGQAAFIEKTSKNQGQVSGLQNGRLPFGERLARRLERELGLPTKWLDHDRTQSSETTLAELNRVISKIDWLDDKAKAGILKMIESLKPAD